MASLGTGFKDFFYAPYLAVVNNPRDLGEGLGKVSVLLSCKGRRPLSRSIRSLNVFLLLLGNIKLGQKIHLWIDKQCKQSHGHYGQRSIQVCSLQGLRDRTGSTVSRICTQSESFNMLTPGGKNSDREGPKNVGEGLLYGARDLGKGVLGGVTGVFVRLPLATRRSLT